MKCSFVAIALLAALICAPPADAAEEKTEKPIVQIAILLDTSGSMSGLIDQAKAQLWSIVNEFATATQNGVQPELQVALYEYGNNGKRHLRMICPLTDDLDKISQEMFALRTSGGAEYCGEVIKMAIEGLKWSESKSAYKAVFIAGNEPFTQGAVNYVESCKAAIAKGIIVNTIHCGDLQVGVNTKWKHGAELADGIYCHIDQNGKVVKVTDVPAPQDAAILKLGKELNKTYVGYGADGKEREKLQDELDKLANAIAPSVSVEREITKAGAHYINPDWDVIDRVRDNIIQLDDIKPEDLPEAMRKMTVKERRAYVVKLTRERADIQKKIKDLAAARKAHMAKLAEERKAHIARVARERAAIQKELQALAAKQQAHMETHAEERTGIQEKIAELTAKRNQFIIEERKRLADSGDATLGAAIIKAVRAQAEAHKFAFGEK